MDSGQGIAALRRQLAAGHRSVGQVTESFLRRAQSAQSRLSAFITLCEEQARAAAAALDAQRPSGGPEGALAGIPVAIKDFYDTAGIRTTAAFEHFARRIPKRDAAAVSRLKAAGAIILGKTNMHMLGMGTTGLESAFGPAVNPNSARHIPGGSSSGSAVAISAGLCMASLDTDAVGSARLPAACCGVVGFKPSAGSISTEGILEGEQAPPAEIQWLAHAAITAPGVDDVARMLEVLAPGLHRRRANPARPLRVVVASNTPADPEVLAAVERAAEILGRQGRCMARGPAPLTQWSKGIVTIEADRAAVQSTAFSQADVYLLPTMPTIVPTIESARHSPQALPADYTLFANYYGLPAISLPAGRDAHGLPLSVQLVGAPGQDFDILAIAAKLAGDPALTSQRRGDHATPTESNR